MDVDSDGEVRMAKKRAADFLDEMDAERTARNPDFPRIAAEAEARREIGRLLARTRVSKKLSQEKVAQRMKATQATVSKLENGADVMLSTLMRYAKVLGVQVAFKKETG
jgi:DNA-binding XRE family transcriptional regulator